MLHTKKGRPSNWGTAKAPLHHNEEVWTMKDGTNSLIAN